MEKILVSMKGIDKSFPGVRALIIANLNYELVKFMLLLAKMVPVNLP